jgi:hypothetical protein
MRAAAAVLLAALSACGGLVPAKGTELTYSQVQVAQKGLTAAQVRDAFGEPLSAERAPDGKIRSMEYAVIDPKGERARLRLEFDARETVVQKSYTGAVPR